MFVYFRKRKEQREQAKAREAAFCKVAADFSNGCGNTLEAALVLHLASQNHDTLSRLLITFGGAEIFTLSNGPDRLRDAAVTEGPDGVPYIATFSSPERIGSTRSVMFPDSSIVSLSALELVFALTPGVGVLLNYPDDHVRWIFTSQYVADLQTLFERSHNYKVGGLFSVWQSGAYRIVKVLHADETGVHLRLYSNTWSERPTQIDPSTLSLLSPDDGHIHAIGHFPVTKRLFLSMGPKLVSDAEVGEDELEGYRLWEASNGGYFGYQAD